MMINPDFWRGKRVLLTGHTGFKGGWLALWLAGMGARVEGIALAPDTDPAFFDRVGVAGVMAASRLLDIREREALRAALAEAAPEIVLHLAAQPLVRRSYDDPVETFATNVMGTAHLLEACRDLPGLRAILVVTTDKVYQNREWDWPYRETDPLGGKDPYSASKAACELVVGSYAESFFARRGIPVATARGGNVIGGGDWSADRLLPDVFRAAAAGTRLVLRAPEAVRPWQHVLALGHGYLSLVEAMASGRLGLFGTWNFGPPGEECWPVRAVIERLAALGIAPGIDLRPDPDKPESRMLALDSSRARAVLGWRPALGLEEALRWTAAWHVAAERGEDLRALSAQQIAAYAERLG